MHEPFERNEDSAKAQKLFSIIVRYEIQWRVVGRVVASDISGPGFNSRQRQYNPKVIYHDLVQSLYHTYLTFLNGPNLASFCLSPFFSHDKYTTNLTINDGSIDGAFGTLTRDGRIIGAEEST